VFSAEDRTIGIVIERDQILSPEKRYLSLRGQENAECASKALRPGFDGAQWRYRPVRASDEVAHFATPDNDIGGIEIHRVLRLIACAHDVSPILFVCQCERGAKHPTC
jgi:hypothetical protein